MKNLTKLFVAVVALFAFSCATDATQDLAVGLAGNTTLTLSLDEATKTHLGEKLNGVYPLYWSEGDQISVNGVVSKALAQGGSAEATFSFDGTLSYPYSVVYPASEGANEVTFPSAQRYVDGTFAEGAVPMYGYAERVGDAVQMQHLAGVLRFPIWGEGTISSVVVEAEIGSLSGSYTVDCATGELTPKSGSTSNGVSVTFGDGLALTAEATPIYVAVPAGSYGEVWVSVYTTDGKKMKAKFDTTSKPISAGKVREFGAFKFEGTVNNEIVIDSKEALINFASNPSKNAVVTANIDMTGEKWTPIDGYSFVFDGGNCEIKGLTAPLFGSVVGSIKNVKLVDVNINETVNPNVGALARNIVASGEASFVTNCGVSGTITVNCPNYMVQTASSNEEAAVAGLVGFARGVEFSNCKNSANITTYQVAADNCTNVANITVAGIAGYIDATETNGIPTSMTNCENSGNLTFENKSATTTAHQLFLAGVFGQSRVGNTDSKTSYLTNRGALLCQAPPVGTPFVGGVGGHTTWQTFSHYYNYGSITLKGVANGNVYSSIQAGGILGYGYRTQVNDAHNYGSITVDDSAKYKYILLGGILGKLTRDDILPTIEDSSNSGAITVKGTSAEGSNYFRVGGLCGWTQNGMVNCTNHKSGTITIDATVNVAETTGATSVGGVVGYKTVGPVSNIKNEADINIKLNAPASECKQNYFGGAYGYIALTAPAEASDVTNEGNITVDGTYNNGVRLGGVFGCKSNAQMARGLVNSGDVTLAESAVVNVPASVFVSGIHASYVVIEESRAFCNVKAVGRSEGTIVMANTSNGNTNYATKICVGGTIEREKGKVITLTPENVLDYLFKTPTSAAFAANNKIGYISSIDAEPQIPELDVLKIASVADLKAFAESAATLDKDVLLTADLDVSKENWTPIGDFGCSFDGDGHTIKGLNAPLFGITQAMAIRNLHLTEVAITEKADSYVGAIARKILNTNAVVENCSASGTMEFVGSTSMAEVYAAGLVGATDSTREWSKLTNEVNITVTGSFANHAYFIGCVAYGKVAMREFTNLGTIHCSGSFAGKSPRLGGIASYSGSMYSCVNGDPEDKTQTKGSLTFDGTITGTAGFAMIAGVTVLQDANSVRDTVDDCHNYGRLTMGGTSSSKNWVSLAGIAANLQNINNLTNCSNNGELVVNQTKTGAANTFVAGMGNHPGAGIDLIKDCVNNGAITIESEASLNGDLLIGGMANVCDNAFVVENVTNNGNITFDGTISGSLQLGAAIGGRIKGGVTFKGNIVNNGNVLCLGTAKKNASVGGMIGLYEAAIADTYFAEATMINRGRMTFDGTCPTDGTAFCMGGIFGRWYNSGTYNATNEGGLEVTAKASAPIIYVGGFAGGSPTKDAIVTGASSICTIKAYILQNNQATRIPNVGLLLGKPYSETSKGVNCKVGGLFIDRVYYDEDADDVVEGGISITADNYHIYMYGVPADKDAVAADGCTVVPYLK